MPNQRQPSFDHEATLDELAGIGKNRRFEEAIDDEFDDIQIICKNGDEEMPSRLTEIKGNVYLLRSFISRPFPE